MLLHWLIWQLSFSFSFFHSMLFETYLVGGDRSTVHCPIFLCGLINSTIDIRCFLTWKRDETQSGLITTRKRGQKKRGKARKEKTKKRAHFPCPLVNSTLDVRCFTARKHDETQSGLTTTRKWRQRKGKKPEKKRQKIGVLLQFFFFDHY